MLYFKTSNGAVPWVGDVIDDVRHPLNIEDLWTDAQLAAINLYRPAPADPVPDGKIVTGQSVQIVAGIVRTVLELEDVPGPTVVNVDIERDRRLALGFTYSFSDARGTHRIGTTQKDIDSWGKVQAWATSKHILSQDDATTVILTDTGAAMIKPLEWFAIADAMAAFQQPIWAAAIALYQINPIPADYAADSRWP